jgi:hypothetical protein
MNPDDLKQAWETQSSQSRLTIDLDLLLKEVRRNQELLAAIIFWRDFREVGTAILLVPVWLYMGSKMSLPWTWYLTIPALLWVAGFMLVDRKHHRRQPPELSEPIYQCVQSSLAQVDHQIWLLRNVFWWYLLPFALSILIFFGQVAWQTRAGGWLAALVMVAVVAIASCILAFVYRLNQVAVRMDLIPRRQELETLVQSLKGDSPTAGHF